MAALGASTARRVAKSVPLARLLLVGEVALMTGRHLKKLDAEERRRLGSLVLGSARKRGTLSAGERVELVRLVAKLEPRLLFGTAVRRVSPVPIPGRILYGRKSGVGRHR
ncbi:MAG TPA: hypothetical protein VH061_09670 [Solirubrobacteraceae bacterium]|jgi:hypothetical protein|nr:hypothetical protein [Solirubrobacteraceae bacterium]